MLAKCANPDCTERFHHMSQGRLFHFHRCEPGRNRDRVEHFWLCRSCCGMFTLRFHPDGSQATIPVLQGAAWAHITSITKFNPRPATGKERNHDHHVDEIPNTAELFKTAV